jgi:hypothetical protein
MTDVTLSAISAGRVVILVCCSVQAHIVRFSDSEVSWIVCRIQNDTLSAAEPVDLVGVVYFEVACFILC